MADQLTKDKVKMGYVLPVKNLGRKPNEKERYLAVYIENQNGEGERWILFSDKEIQRKRSFSIRGVTDGWKLGRLFCIQTGGTDRIAINLHFCEDISSLDGSWSVRQGESKVLLFTSSSIVSAEKRASKNPEDLPKMGWLENLKN